MELLPFERQKPNILIKKHGTTNDKHGCYPDKRNINQYIEYGIVNINKPSGPTSHQVSAHVRTILNLSKAGHSGTLDPKVTGVLAVALGKATRVVQTLLPAGKEYIALMKIHKEATREQIEKTFKKFTGEISQLPPVRSAVKRQLRPRTIYYMTILEIKGQDILFKVGCEAGTYIRKLIHDMGKDLGKGANMVQLVRTKAGPFKDNNWHTLQDLRDAYEIFKESKDESHLRKIIEPCENAINHLPKIWVFDTAVGNLCHGAQLAPQGISKLTDNFDRGDSVAVLSLKNELVCLGRAIMSAQDVMNNKKGIAIITEKVFMERDVYPRQRQ